jgi:hypothetical protein
MAQMLTANRLVDGTVVYWRDGQWVEALGEGNVFSTETEGEAARAASQPFVTDNTVINPYLFDVRPDGTPVKEREIIRAAGPSIHDNLGKQAEGLAPDRRAARDVPTKVKTEKNVSL